MKWTIKQASKETGLSTDTLRYYEKEKIIVPKRHENGYRYYNEDDIFILKIIVVMKYAHFTLYEIKSMVKLFEQEPAEACNEDCNEAGKQILSSKIVELEQKMMNYKHITMLMKELLPLIDNIDNTQESIEYIDGFIEKIFNNVKNMGG